MGMPFSLSTTTRISFEGPTETSTMKLPSASTLSLTMARTSSFVIILQVKVVAYNNKIGDPESPIHVINAYMNNANLLINM